MKNQQSSQKIGIDSNYWTSRTSNQYFHSFLGTFSQLWKQTNSIDCGIFLYRTCNIDCKWKTKPDSFDVNQMRDHLLTCLQLGEFSPFPNTEKRVVRKRHQTLFFDIFCICRDAYFCDDGNEDDEYFMAICCICKEWFHKRCSSIPIKVFCDEKTHKLWKCTDCC